MKLFPTGLRKMGLLAALIIVALVIVGCDETPRAEANLTQPEQPANIVAVQEGDDQREAMQLVGIVETLTGTTVRLNGLSVDISRASNNGLIEEGATIQVQGRRADDGAVVAEYVWVLEPAAAPTAVRVSEIPFVIEGPVTALSGRRVRIHGFDLELDDDDRIRGIQVGDVLRVGGNVNSDRLDDLFDGADDDDIDDDRYVAVRDTQLAFLSNPVYANADGQLWRDSGLCADAPPGWAQATEWRARCSGEFGGGRVNTDASTDTRNDSSGANTGNPPPAGGGGAGNSVSPAPAQPPAPPPPPPPPAGGNGSSGSSSGSWSGS